MKPGQQTNKATLLLCISALQTAWTTIVVLTTVPTTAPQTIYYLPLATNTLGLEEWLLISIALFLLLVDHPCRYQQAAWWSQTVNPVNFLFIGLANPKQVHCKALNLHWSPNISLLQYFYHNHNFLYSSPLRTGCGLCSPTEVAFKNVQM